MCTAAQNGHVEAIRLLCELGADVNTPTNKGVTPVHAAAQQGHIDVVAVNGHVEAIRALCKLGADFSTPNKDGITPVSMAA